MRLPSTTRDPGEPAPDPPRAREVGLPGPGRLGSYRLLARKAVQADTAKRLASDGTLRSQLRVARRAPGGNASTAARRAEAARTTALKPPWAAEVELRCLGRFKVSRDGVTVARWRPRTAERRP